MDHDTAQQHRLDTMLSQRTLMGLSDNPHSSGHEPMLAMINQAHRAREGDSDGFSAMTVPF